MSPRMPKDVIAVTPGGKITMDHIIGWATAFSVPNRPVKATDLMRAWGGLSLDPRHLPPARKALNVFQLACRSVETRRTDKGDRDVEVKVDETMIDQQYCVYQITRMVRDRTNRVIEHPKAMRVVFDRGLETIKFEPLEQESYDALSYLEEQIRDWYDKNSSKVPGDKVRALLRGVLRDLGATNMLGRAGGLYFVPKGGASQKTIKALQGVLEQLYNGDSELFTLAIASAKSEKELVQRHFNVHMDDEVTEQIGKVSEVLKRDPKYVRKDLLRNVIEDRKRLGDLHSRYKDLLGSSLREANDKLKLLDQQVEELLVRADELGTEAA